MRFSALVDLANRTLRADPRRALVDAVACCAGAAALVFFVALGLGTADAVRGLFPGEARLVEVVPSGVSLGPVLGGAKLDDGAVERLRALHGVEAAYPKLNLRVPVTASRAPEGLGIYWPRNLSLQVPSVGVPRELVEGDRQLGRAAQRAAPSRWRESAGGGKDACSGTCRRCRGRRPPRAAAR